MSVISYYPGDTWRYDSPACGGVGVDKNSPGKQDSLAADAEKIGKIHAANLKVGAWTVDDPAEMEMLENEGIDPYVHFPADRQAQPNTAG